MMKFWRPIKSQHLRVYSVIIVNKAMSLNDVVSIIISLKIHTVHISRPNRSILSVVLYTSPGYENVPSAPRSGWWPIIQVNRPENSPHLSDRTLTGIPKVEWRVGGEGRFGPISFRYSLDGRRVEHITHMACAMIVNLSFSSGSS